MTGKSKWVCLCDCGNAKEVIDCNLKNGNTKSCGCLQKEKTQIMRDAHRKYNNYKECDDFYIFYTDNMNSLGENFFVIDKDDFKKVRKHRWYFENHDYVRCGLTSKNKMLLHLYIIDKQSDRNIHIDHLNHHKNDNRKSNLEIKSSFLNAANRGIQKNNTSGISGVSKRGNKYRATMSHMGKIVLNKTFNTLEEAVEARNEAQKLYLDTNSYEECMKRAPQYCFPTED